MSQFEVSGGSCVCLRTESLLDPEGEAVITFTKGQGPDWLLKTMH